MTMTPDIKERTKFYTEANLNRTQIQHLLLKEFPEKQFLPKTISNAMQIVKTDNDNKPSEAAALISHLQHCKEEDQSWFVEFDLDSTGHSRRLFWMTLLQRQLYQRYSDVDATANTNRFKMTLCNFVIVDTNNRSRLVASALICQEGTEDYEWILRNLLVANNRIIPTVLLVDEDTAMEAACIKILPETSMVSCIWHLASLNLKKNLQKQLGNKWAEFVKHFWRTRNAITPEEFEQSWTILQHTYGNDRSNHYLERLYRRRQRWAWPWVGSKFTAGMQSTQRVEKAHAIIKNLVSGQSTKLSDLFSAIEKKISDEKSAASFLNYKVDIGVNRSHSKIVTTIFTEIENVNQKFLGSFALFKMRQEMIASMMYQAKSHEDGSVRDIVEVAEQEENANENKVSINDEL